MGRPVQTQSPRMGRPDETPSPRMNSNFNPMFHAQPPPEPPPPVHEKQMVQTAQRYPNNGGRVNQQNQVPMARPGQPPYIHTNATVNQPYVVAVPTVRPVHFVHPQPSNWTTGLCDCFDDPLNAIITWCCPCITFGQIAEIIDEGATSCGMAGMLYILILSFFWVPCVYTCTYRTKLRNKFGLPEAPAPDWITHFFCEYCAICQAYRELNNRGLDPAIGWLGNVQRQRMRQQQEMMAPPMAQRMTG